MKLYEIAQHLDVNAMREWCKKWFGNAHDKAGIFCDEDGIHSDDGVSVTIYKEMLENGMLPFPFHFVGGDFKVDVGAGLRSMKGCPEEVDGDFTLFKCHLVTNFEGAPKSVAADFDIIDTGITDFRGIADHIEYAKRLSFSPENIKNGGIGCIFINGLKTFYFSMHASDKDREPFRIIEKYLQKPDQLFDCQQELIDAGYEAYAEL